MRKLLRRRYSVATWIPIGIAALAAMTMAVNRGVLGLGTALEEPQAPHYFVNAGDCGATDWSDATWESDQSFDDEWGFVGDRVSGSWDLEVDDIYRCASMGQSFGYQFEVPNGEYAIRLYFLEPEQEPGGRQFDVTIEGDKVLDDFDIAAEAGGTAIGVERSFTVNVEDGRLEIGLEGGEEGALVNAIAVEGLSLAEPPDSASEEAGEELPAEVEPEPTPILITEETGEEQPVELEGTEEPTSDEDDLPPEETGGEDAGEIAVEELGVVNDDSVTGEQPEDEQAPPGSEPLAAAPTDPTPTPTPGGSEANNTLTPGPGRWVIDTERGQIMALSPVDAYAEWGAAVFVPNKTQRFCDAMEPEALKIPHARFTNFGPGDAADSYMRFPWAELVAYNEAEIAAGRPSLFITAGGQPVRRGSTDRVAVNVGDDRFIDFWINNFIRARILTDPTTGEPYDCENIWIAVDNAIFQRGWFTPSRGWDAPFPQTEQEYMDSIMYFFQRVHELAPDIHIIANTGTHADESQFAALHANIEGLMFETFPTSPRTKAIRDFRRSMWYAEQNRVAILRPRLRDDAQLGQNILNAYMAYLTVRGDNFFFAPRWDDRSEEIPESYYAAAREALGWHTGPAEEVQPEVWQRVHQGGIVYLNWSANTVTLPVPAGYQDRNGNAVTSITLSSMSGGYVVGTAGALLTQSEAPIPVSTDGGDGNDSGDGNLDVPIVYAQYVNAGQCDPVTWNSMTWAADQTYTPGSWGHVGSDYYAVADDIADPVSDETRTLYGAEGQYLHKCQVYGEDFGYQFDLPNGNYEIHLRFAEPLYEAGERWFDVLIEGAVALDDFDVSQAAGGQDVALERAFIVTVADEQLRIDFVGGQSGSPDPNALLQAISVTAAEPVAEQTSDPATPEPATPDPATPELDNYETEDLASDSPGETPPTGDQPVDFQPYIQYVNAGRCGAVVWDGATWAADQPYTAGGWGHVGSYGARSDRGARISDPSGVLYSGDAQTLHRCRAQGRSFGYRFDVPNGTYQVRLLFAEPRFNPGRRLFDVAIEGQVVLDDFDIAAEAGQRRVAVERTFEIVVTDGQVTIDFQGQQPGSRSRQAIVQALGVIALD